MSGTGSYSSGGMPKNPTFSTLKISAGGTFDLYNTADQTTNFERLRAEWSGNVASLYITRGGTGVDREFRIGNAAVAYMRINPSASFLRLGNGGGNLATATVFSNLGEWGATASSGTQTITSISPNINQSGTAGYTAFDINPTETATGSGTKLLQRWAVAGITRALLRNDGHFAVSGGLFSSYLALGGTPTSLSGDVVIVRDGANVLALQNSANAQTFRVYNTYTDGSNYRRWNLSWNTTTAIMQVVGAGTGTNGNLAVGNAALATTDTVGYFMIPSSAGAPTGVPADIPTGQVALHFDSTNNKLYVYDGGWLSTAALT